MAETKRCAFNKDRQLPCDRLSQYTDINIKFIDILYNVKNGKQIKPVLNGISGEFRAGELSAIIGPSGCGKTTLLNILAGYGISTNDGTIYINDKSNQVQAFRKKTRYVLQDDEVSHYFTILEAMMFATNFKMPYHSSRQHREEMIFEILDMLHLRQKSNALMATLSGGERKRICIALELIDNPSVLLLDEPITGLDEFSATQCIKTLKRLADCGRTVICTLHCPSARLLQMVDKVFAMSSGECIYQGDVDNIVPYLKDIDLECPVTHNPTDFIIDVATKAYGEYQNIMVRKIHNGKVFKWNPQKEANADPTKMEDLEMISIPSSKTGLPSSLDSKKEILPWCQEYKYIFIYFMQQMWRDMINFKLRIAAYVLCCILGGLNYIEIGQNAQCSLFYYSFSLATSLLFSFLAMAPMIGNVPRDILYMKREYFNRWYRLSTYYMALVTSQLPLLCPMSLIGAAILYLITGQPLDFYRFTLYYVNILLVSLLTSSFGILLGASFKSLSALFAGPIFIIVMSIFGHQRVSGTNLTSLQEHVLTISYMTYTVEGLMYSLLDLDRPHFQCPSADMFCLTTKPKYVLKLLGFSNVNYIRCAMVLLGFTCFLTLLAFVILKCRLHFKRKSKKL
ncbi:ATP-binding cassette subfamily G member 4-like [Haematobia irritans]|uniref:ATP-binding cassette subfamily G member 4-like n=1 Tax=Haematobia irritans TaxID=7368 RepID=UPI003F503E5C